MIADEIPPMTDPLSRHWDQPSRDQILLDGVHAMMSQETFNQLAEYNTSMPTAVYPGKMWKCKRETGWQLWWYGLHEDPDRCSIQFRHIVLL